MVNAALSPEMLTTGGKKSRTKIIFHIGLEKTGTTSFQSFCTDNRVWLRRQSVLYPTNNFGFSKNSHEPLVACYFPNSLAGQLMMRTSRYGKHVILQSLHREIQRASVDTVLISAEHFSSRFSPAHILQLATDFSDYDCRIAIVVRDHVTRVLSAYSTTIVSGRHLTLKEFVDEICHPSNLYIRYRETIAQWEAVFGHNSMMVFAYREKYNIVEILVNNLISPNVKSHRIGDYIQNTSFGASGIEKLRLINKDLSERQEPGAPKFHPVSILDYMLHALRKKAVRPTEDRLHFSEEQLERVNSIAEPDRRWLADRYSICLEAQCSDHDVL